MITSKGLVQLRHDVARPRRSEGLHEQIGLKSLEGKRIIIVRENGEEQFEVTETGVRCEDGLGRGEAPPFEAED